MASYSLRSFAKLDFCKKQSIVIKTPVTKWRRAKNWGDYHLAVLLKKKLEEEGHRVLLQILPEWDNQEGLKYDVAIVFRGLSRYTIKNKQFNIMWNISHPDDITLEEYEEYDQVFIASDYWSNKIAAQVSVPVAVMLQCTDINRFKVPNNRDKRAYSHQLLFIGNSRGVYRKVLRDLLPTQWDLAVYGKNWKKLLPKKYIRGSYIKNCKLFKYYGSAEILLNDHWDDMREKGFISNRIYDGLACGAFILTDKVKLMGELGCYIQTYDSPSDLQKKIKFYLNNPEIRKDKAQKGMKYVRDNHTFDERAKVFSELICSMANSKK